MEKISRRILLNIHGIKKIIKLHYAVHVNEKRYIRIVMICTNCRGGCEQRWSDGRGMPSRPNSTYWKRKKGMDQGHPSAPFVILIVVKTVTVYCQKIVCQCSVKLAIMNTPSTSRFVYPYGLPTKTSIRKLDTGSPTLTLCPAKIQLPSFYILKFHLNISPVCIIRPPSSFGW
jgi:hypothetical protein